jgi:hypothetical protein
MNESFRYIIATDVRDVVFQKNPSDVMESILGQDENYSYLLSSESLLYRDEPWGNNNLLHSFGPAVHSIYTNRAIVNCGVLSGKADAMIDLCLAIFLATGKAPDHVPGGGGPDQATLNILMGMSPYKDHAYIASTLEPWAAQLGTQGDPTKMESFEPHLLHPKPLYRDGQFVSPMSGDPYAIVHQWDRMSSDVTQSIMEKYSS